jgi:hypothetical protein
MELHILEVFAAKQLEVTTFDLDDPKVPSAGLFAAGYRHLPTPGSRLTIEWS